MSRASSRAPGLSRAICCFESNSPSESLVASGPFGIGRKYRNLRGWGYARNPGSRNGGDPQTDLKPDLKNSLRFFGILSVFKGLAPHLVLKESRCRSDNQGKGEN